MNFRWLTVKNRINREEVELFAATNQISKSHAKELLEDKTTTVLQYTNNHIAGPEQWLTVPHVTLYRGEE